MRRCRTMLVLGVGLLGGPLVRGNVVVTMEAIDADGNVVVGEVAPGTTLSVEIRLSVDSEHNPLPDVLALSFDFRATDESIQRGLFYWSIDLRGYSFVKDDLPNPLVFSSLGRRSPLVVGLEETPLTVACNTATWYDWAT